MSLLPGVVFVGGVLLYNYYKWEPEPPPTEKPVPVTSTHVSSTVTGPATLASSLSTRPGTFVPVADSDRALYATQIKHLSIASRFAYG